MLRQLGESTGELATLMVLSGTVGVTIDVMQGYHPLVLPGLLGGHHPLHATAGGKALLAWRPEETLGEYLKPPLKRYTASTITDLAVLKREFAQARKRGYTSVVGEWFDDVVGVAAPVRNHRGEIIAALTVGCPRSRATSAKMAQLSRAVLMAGESTSRTLGHGLGAGIRLGAPAGRALSGR
jgi:DNA-binding IclR family transcriptional regulator